MLALGNHWIINTRRNKDLHGIKMKKSHNGFDI